MTFVFGSRKKAWPTSCTLQIENVVSVFQAFQGPQGLKLVNAKVYSMLPPADFCYEGGAIIPPTFDHISIINFYKGSCGADYDLQLDRQI